MKWYLCMALVWILAFPFAAAGEATGDNGTTSSATPPATVAPAEAPVSAGLESLLFAEIPVVTASRKQEKLSKAPANITVVTAEDLKRRGIRTVSEALTLIPGIEIATHRKGSKEIWVRGIASPYNDKVLMLVDGYPWRELIYGQFPIDEMLSIENIKRIEIIKGPGSALYGTNAFVGVINIITKDGADVAGCEVQAGGGSFTTKLASALAGQKSDHSDFTFFGRYYETQGDEKERDQKGALTTRKNAKNQSEVNFKGTFLDDFKIGLRQIKYSFQPFLYEDCSWRQENWNDSFLHLEYAHALPWSLSVQGRVYYSYYDHATVVEKGYANSAARQNLQHRTETSGTLGAGVQVEFDGLPQNSLIGGVDYEYDQIYTAEEIEYDYSLLPNPLPVTTRTTAIPHPSNTNVGFFLEDTWEATDWIKCVAGARYDHSLKASALSPSVSLIVAPLSELTCKLMYGTAFRRPSFREWYIQEGNSSSENGNQDLTPEKIKNLELNVNYVPLKMLSLKAAIFNQEISDMIASNGDEYINVGTGLTQGVEVGAEAAVIENLLSVFANYTYNFKATTDDEDSPFISKQMGNAGFRLDAWNYLCLDASIHYNGQRNRSADYHSSVKGASIKAIDNLGAYKMVNVTLSTRHLPVDVSVTVDNVLGEKAYTPSFNGYYDAQMEGLSVLGKLTYRF